ncbi:MAG: Hpt domain-containing protein [Gammaproteobacteria bacterium]|nr:Hpt domain-containing protein [Gammaproteobacteria bacterium]MBQ0839148.1 Hpt domain-containing protein [Gammaproteobacteria bacterium]
MKMTHSLRGLEWLVEELETSLGLARESLFAFLSEPEDASQLSFALGYLHQVSGSLTMAECYGAVLLANEMEAVLQMLLREPTVGVADACEALELTMLALPNYVRDLLDGSDDTLAQLIEQVNELRAVRAEPLLSSTALFMPKMVLLDQLAPRAEGGATAVDNEMLGKLQKVYQYALLGYLKQRDLAANQQKIVAVLRRLQGLFKDDSVATLWRVASAFFTALVDNHISQSAATRYLLWELDKAMGSLLGVAEPGLQLQGLLRNLLYYIALAPDDSAALKAIKEEFALDLALPSLTLAELDGALQTRLDGAAVTALCDTLSTEIASLVAAADSFEGGDRAEQLSLGEIKLATERLATTLLVVGQIKLSQSLLEVAEVVDKAMSCVADPASDLSTVSTRLQSLQQSLQDWALNYADVPLATDLLSETAYVVDDAQRSLIREVRNNFESIKESIVGYIASQWDGQFLLEIPQQFEHIFGAVEVIGLKRVALIVEQLGHYITRHLLHSEQPPEWSDLDALADAITGFEYYLEAIDKGREAEQHDMLQRTVQAMEKLGFAVELETEESAQQSVEPLAGDDASGAIELDADTPQLAGEELDGEEDDDDIDPEIKEIFIEEAQEVLAELETNYPTWLLDQTDHKALNELRRGFHTLKGSGRMVKANVIGDLAWAIESMLNKILDNSGSTVPETAELLDISLALIPSLVEDFERDAQHLSAYCENIIAAADALTRGEPVLIPQSEEQLVELENLQELDVDLLIPGAADEEEALAELEDSAEIEPVVQIFVGEASAYIDTLAHFLDDFQQPHEGSRLAPADVQRALHTLQASAGMAGVNVVPELVKTVEDFLAELFAEGQSVSSSIIALLMVGVEQLRNTLARLEAGEGEDSTALNEYLSRVEQARTQWQAHKVSRSTPRGLARVQQLMVTGLDNILLADTLLQQWGAQPSFSREDIAPVVSELVELGSAAEDSGVSALSILCDQLARGLGDFADTDQRLNEDALGVFKAAHELLLNMMDTVAIGQPVSPASEALLAQLQAQASSAMPAAASQATDVLIDATEPVPQQAMAGDELARRMAGEVHDPEVLQFFLEEADDLLENIENAMQAWRDEPVDVTQGEILNRVLHTLKGGARVAGLSLLGDLSHDLEALILQQESQLASGDAGMFDQLFARFDELVSVLDRVKSGGAMPPVDALPPIAEPLVAESVPETATDPVPEHEPVLEPVEPLASVASIDVFEDEVPEDEVLENEVDNTTVAAAELPELAKPELESEQPLELSPATIPAPELKAQPTPRAKPAVVVQESVKIPAQVLDDLVNLAGEASIARGRVEQGVGESASALDEMEETISRLRHQVRQLGRQTEAQIQFRREQIESSQSADFDPLELDRYSQLQQLSQGLEESGSDLQDLKDTLLEKSQAVEGLLLMQSRITQDLQENLMKTRLVPFSRLVPRLRRIVRQVGQELGKQVNLGLNNIEGEMDRSVLEKIITPIEHMLRNAIDHGIESTEQRQAAGKPDEGNISLSFQREGGEVVITVADDGKGLDVAAIREKAINKRMIAADTQASDSELLRLIFQPGFSTATSVSQVSGRGVGMDVVKTEVHQLGGSISIESALGQGVEFTIRLPFTVSVNKALLVKESASIYALPLSSIVGVTQLSAEETDALYSEPGKQLEYAGFDYQLCSLGSLLSGDQEPPATVSGKAVMVLVDVDHYRYAVHVDAIEGNQEIIVKGLGAQFRNVPGVAGATILASGKVVVILDLPSLLRSRGERSILEGPEQAADLLRGSSFDNGANVDATVKTIMVVDDSVTVRKVTSRVLEREGFHVVTAKDGVEATDMLAQTKPDLMLLDIEMPRMDGFEVARVVRDSEAFSRLPIIMISSRTGEKHQQRATSLGVNKFLGKPYQEDELLGLLDELLNLGKA